MKVLVAGWFSFPEMGATAGDLLSRDVVCQWLRDAGRSYSIAVAPPFEGGIDWRVADPGEFSDVVFVCGPFGNGWPIPEFLERFAGCRMVGMNLSMIDPLDAFNPFHLLFERDSSRRALPDLVLMSPPAVAPVVGVVLVHPQREYASGLHDRANAAIERLVVERSVAPVRIDTRLDVNAAGLRTPAQVESLIARMDVVLTTRLHGLVLSLKRGVPPVVIDPVARGAKVVRQAAVLGWPAVFTADAVTDAALADAFEWAMTAEARATARECVERARTVLLTVADEFVSTLARPNARVRR